MLAGSIGRVVGGVSVIRGHGMPEGAKCRAQTSNKLAGQFPLSLRVEGGGREREHKASIPSTISI